MKKYRVVFKKSARKELAGLPRGTQRKVVEAVELLEVNPFSSLLPIRKMAGRDDDNRFRLRLGDYRFVYTDYRFVYTVEKKVVTVHIVRIGHRKDVYR